VNDLKLIWGLLSLRERRHGVLVTLVMLGVAGLEMVGVASVLPFLAVLSQPELIETNALLAAIFSVSRRFGVESADDFLIALGVVMVCLIGVSSLYRVAAS
jgi:ATP-binding cassette, subfamily B, bacterial PglK